MCSGNWIEREKNIPDCSFFDDAYHCPLGSHFISADIGDILRIGC